MKHPKKGLWAIPLAGALILAACGGDDGDDGDVGSPVTGGGEGGAATTASTSGGAGSAVSLAGICPETIVIQTDWNPESEHGGVYEMIGDDPVIDADQKTVRGPLVAGGQDTGVQLEVRTGGPAIGFQPVVAQMYQDDDITFGFVYTDEAIQFYSDQPTKAVVGPLDINPQMIMWDPATYPDVGEIADLKATGATVRYFDGAAYMEYLVGAGLLDRSQLDGTYDGTAAVFVSQEGSVAQQGFASAEPYIYENEVENWEKPIDFQLVHDAGWQPYSQPLALRLADYEELTPCLERFVPMVQQAQVDYIQAPEETNGLILELVEQYDTGWVYTPGVAEFSVQQQLDLGLVGNGPDSTLGNFDEQRITDLIAKALPVYAALGGDVKEDLTVDDLVSNDFIDPSIRL